MPIGWPLECQCASLRVLSRLRGHMPRRRRRLTVTVTGPFPPPDEGRDLPRPRDANPPPPQVLDLCESVLQGQFDFSASDKVPVDSFVA